MAKLQTIASLHCMSNIIEIDTKKLWPFKDDQLNDFKSEKDVIMMSSVTYAKLFNHFLAYLSNSFLAPGRIKIDWKMTKLSNGGRFR